MRNASAEPDSRRAVVIGAGLAGLTAAINLVDAGWQVTLVERRPFAGGRTFSFTTDQGDQLDNGQHVFLGCCTAYLALLDKLSRRERVFEQRRLDVRFLDARDGPARLREWPLPAPLHLLLSFLAFRYLSPGEKLAALRALAIMRRRRLSEDESFQAWLERHNQTANAIHRLWNLIVIPTCNAPAVRISAAMGGFIFHEGLLRTRWGGRLGYPRVGLSEVVPAPAVEYLQSHGADLRFGTTIVAVDERNAVTSLGEQMAADVVIVAVPASEIGRILPSLAGQVRLEEAPIVGINLWYDRPLFDGEVLAVIVDAEAFWLFDRTRILGKAGPEHHIAVSISAAEDCMEVPRDELAQQVAAKLAKVLPGPILLRSHVEKVRSATFVPAPGVRRPGSRTGIPGVFLAGSWTDTGWPDTMESAVRSGHQAARLAQDFVQEALH